jgi:GNAT superfamily N-acetyltransferase
VTPRPATPADVSELVRVINVAYQVEAHVFIDERTSASDIRERLGRSNAAFLVIDDDESGVSAGTLAGAVYVETKGGRGYFGMLAVDPSKQGRGLGRALVRAAESYCAAAGCTDLDIDVVDLRTELPPFYQALGFTRVGATPYAEPDRVRQPVQLVHMTKSLV